MTDMSANQATNGVPTYLGRGDPAGRFADYYPAWVDEMASDITLEATRQDRARRADREAHLPRHRRRPKAAMAAARAR